VETRVNTKATSHTSRNRLKKLKNMENVRLSEDVDYASVYGLTREAREKLSKVRPVSLGQASRISGITPAALMAISSSLEEE